MYFMVNRVSKYRSLMGSLFLLGILGACSQPVASNQSSVNQQPSSDRDVALLSPDQCLDSQKVRGFSEAGSIFHLLPVPSEISHEKYQVECSSELGVHTVSVEGSTLVQKTDFGFHGTQSADQLDTSRAVIKIEVPEVEGLAHPSLTPGGRFGVQLIAKDTNNFSKLQLVMSKSGAPGTSSMEMARYLEAENSGAINLQAATRSYGTYHIWVDVIGDTSLVERNADFSNNQALYELKVTFFPLNLHTHKR